MAFRIQLLFVYTTLCLLALCNGNTLKTFEWPKQQEIVGFSWSNCGAASDPIQVKTLTVAPDPIQIPGNITIGTSFSVAAATPTDIALAVTMEKKVAGFYIKVPCIDNIGSCTYGDTCKDWAEACPTYFEKFGIPCNCPIAANTYSAPDISAFVSIKLPPGSTGPFRITGNLVSTTAGHLGCLQVLVDLK